MRLNPYRWAGGAAAPALGTPVALNAPGATAPFDFAVHTAVTGNLLVRFIYRDGGTGITRPLVVEWGDPLLLPGTPLQQLTPIIDTAFNDGTGRTGVYIGYLRGAKLGAQTLRVGGQDTNFGRIGGGIQDIAADWSGLIGDIETGFTNVTIATITSDQVIPHQRSSVIVGVGGASTSAMGPFTIGGLGGAWTADLAAISVGAAPGATAQLVSKASGEVSDPITLQLTSATSSQYWAIGLVEICP